MLSISQLVVVLVIILVLFGAGKLPSVMGDIGRGIKNFRKGASEEKDKNQDKNPKSPENNQDNQDNKNE
jgi:sec-independent protein translocase protein TatA